MPAVHSSPVRSGSHASAATPTSAEGVPRWVWAAALGGGIVLGGAIFYVFWGGAGGDKKQHRPKAPPRKARKGQQGGARADGGVADSPNKGAGPVKVEDVAEDDDEDQLPSDPLERAVSRKNKGNKYFRGGRYELAIKCYNEAIEGCPKQNTHDLSTFYQNRAAAYEQLDSLESVFNDCTSALELNPKYVKAMDRRAKVCRKQAERIARRSKEEESGEGAGPSSYDAEAVAKLKMALDDVTAVCILEGFQKQDHIMLVDAVLKELGRAEAKQAVKTREHILTSKHFIQQYYMSFDEDPIMKDIAKENEGDVDEAGAAASGNNGGDESGDHGNKPATGYKKAKQLMKAESYEGVIAACTEEIEANGEFSNEAKVLRGTFYILSKQQPAAFSDLESVIEDSSASAKLRVNALIKRASLFIQQCKDPIEDPKRAFADFARAVDIDAANPDIYHHRGQVHLLTDQIADATADFAKAVEMNPNFPIAHVQKLYTDYRRATLAQSTEQVNNIINLFEQAIERFPKCVETYALFAQVLSDQQKFERADELYRRAQKIDPANGNLHVHRALILLQWKGEVPGAVELIREGLEADDKCEFAYETLGTIEVQRGNLSEAVDLFNKAIPLANTELEMAHLYGLRDAALAQTEVTRRLGVSMPAMPPMGMMM